MRDGERILQILDFLDKVDKTTGKVVRPNVVGKALGINANLAKAMMLRLKKAKFVDVTKADIGKWEGLEVYKINPHGRWKLKQLQETFGR